MRTFSGSKARKRNRLNTKGTSIQEKKSIN